jgi:predicted permease
MIQQAFKLQLFYFSQLFDLDEFYPLLRDNINQIFDFTSRIIRSQILSISVLGWILFGISFSFVYLEYPIIFDQLLDNLSENSFQQYLFIIKIFVSKRSPKKEHIHLLLSKLLNSIQIYPEILELITHFSEYFLEMFKSEIPSLDSIQIKDELIQPLFLLLRNC